MASSQILSQLAQLESTANASQRTEGFNRVLQEIIANYHGSTLAANLVAYTQSILSDSVGVIHSRPLLSTFIERFRALEDNDAKVEAGTQLVRILAPKIVSYEQQDTDLKFILADAYEQDEDYTNSARTLQTITLDSSQRSVSDDEKSKIWMRICRCYLEEEDPTNALTFLNKVKQVVFSITDPATRLQFQLSQARISDAQRNFLDASASYLALSNETLVDEEERQQALSEAIKCAVLAPAGPQRARQLGKLYKDERSETLPEHSILEKIFLDRLLSPEEVSTFAASLQDHQLAKTSDGSTVLDKAVLEHNLLAASHLYQNISIVSLGKLLGTNADRAETYAAAMMASQRLSGSIDQIDGVIYFNTKSGGSDTSGFDRGAWDANVQRLAEEVERVSTMLQRDVPAFYDKHMTV